MIKHLGGAATEEDLSDDHHSFSEDTKLVELEMNGNGVCAYSVQTKGC